MSRAQMHEAIEREQAKAEAEWERFWFPGPKSEYDDEAFDNGYRESNGFIGPKVVAAWKETICEQNCASKLIAIASDEFDSISGRDGLGMWTDRDTYVRSWIAGAITRAMEDE